MESQKSKLRVDTSGESSEIKGAEGGRDMSPTSMIINGDKGVPRKLPQLSSSFVTHLKKNAKLFRLLFTRIPKFNSLSLLKPLSYETGKQIARV